MANSYCDEALKHQPSKLEAEGFYSTYIVGCVLNAFLSYTTIMLNSATIHAVRKTSSLPTPLRTLLLCLAISDLRVGLLRHQPFAVALVLKWLQNNNPSCTTYAAFTSIFSLFSFALFFWSYGPEYRQIHGNLSSS